MKHVWSILCKSSMIDSENNSISLLRCIEQVNIKNSPPDKTGKGLVVPLEFELISLWFDDSTKKERKFNVRIELFDPSKVKLKYHDNNLVLPKGKKRLRDRTEIKGLPITKSGKYMFKVKYRSQGGKNYKDVAELPIDIVFNG